MVWFGEAVKVDQRVEITDEFSARAWLGKHDHQTQVWFAARCALRALPYLGSWAAATKSGLTFASFRAAFTAAAAATYLNSELVELRKPAIFASKTAAATCMETATAENDRSSHYHAASFSAMQSHAAAAAAASTNTAEAGDAAAAIGSFRLIAAANSFAAATSLDANDILKWNALWGGDDQPPNIAQAWKELKAQWDADDADWSFWINWYEGILNGTPLPWELTHRIALEVTEKEWEAGQTVVARIINEIQADYLADKLPQAETLSREADGKYIVTASVADPDQIIDRIFKQLDFSLDLALRGHNASGFSDMCTAFQYLDHTRQHCRDDPNAVHMHLRLAREIIESRLDTGEYQVEDSLVALVSALERHEIQLRADHPEVRKAYETFVEQRLRELDDEKRLEIAAEFKALSNDSKARLSDEFVLDAATLETSTGVKAQGDAIKRSGGRSQEMSLTERAAAATKTADGSALNKGTGLLLRLEKISDILMSIL